VILPCESSRSLDQPRKHIQNRWRVAFAVGGSPAERPISRCAIAKRVNESTISRTFFLCWQNVLQRLSLQARRATSEPAIDRMWNNYHCAPQSLFADNLKKLANLSARSPTSASTVMSAAVPRAIIPISVLLPTPLPPKIPGAALGRMSETIDRPNSAAQRLTDRNTFKR